MMMAEEALVRLWDDVKAELLRARTILDDVPSCFSDYLLRFSEFLEHNELELALDELVELGASTSPSKGFWEALESAANKMGLTDHQIRIANRILPRSE